MAERPTPTAGKGGLSVSGLHVYYDASHALQGVDLELPGGVLSVVGRNGMGKSTLCKAIVGLVPTARGSISYAGRNLTGLIPSEIARAGVAYVPQGRRLWPTLTVDEHLRLVDTRQGEWNRDRIYATFPRLAERRGNNGSQLSGGEQQMLAISRALLLNPRLLVMDEPTEGLAPVIVDQVVEMIMELADDGGMDVLLIEQNITVASTVAEDVAVMVNGRISNILPAARLAGDRALRQSLLGVGRADDDAAAGSDASTANHSGAAVRDSGPKKIFVSNPAQPTRWSRMPSVRSIENAARVVSATNIVPAAGTRTVTPMRPLASGRAGTVLVVGTLDTKGPEIRYIRDALKAQNVRTTLVDVSTTGKPSGADVPPHQLAAFHPEGGAGVFSSDRGEAVRAMADAFENWVKQQQGIAGIISAAGSGGTAMVTPAMRALPVGVPKVMISTMASGDVSTYVGASDILMLHSVADVQGLNRITRSIMSNGANALIGMVKAREKTPDTTEDSTESKPVVGLSMFGVTTSCVQQISKALDADYECMVFHATGTGCEAMEGLVESGLMPAVIDITTTEVCDRIAGGVMPAHDDRFGVFARKDMPYVGACGALDMVNFHARSTVPERYASRLLYEHNASVTLMRTTPEECKQIGEWIGQRLNNMNGPVRFFLPEGGLSALSGPGQPFHDSRADQALFKALEQTVRQTQQRQLVRSPHNVNDAEFVRAVVAEFNALHAPAQRRTKTERQR